jgi:diguanylate cyclase (GGDEF)-like protein
MNGEGDSKGTGKPGSGRRPRWRRTSTGVVSPPALLDDLTGLPNRRYLEGALHANLEELRRNDRGFGVLLIDIDNFREVNELLGRKYGDKVIRAVGNTLKQRTRPFDVVGRAGGEEFFATIANVSRESLEMVAEKLRKTVEEMEVHTASDTIRVTVSIGGTLAAAEDTKETLIKRAYKLMRKSKSDGKNCITVESLRKGDDEEQEPEEEEEKKAQTEGGKPDEKAKKE